MIKALLVRNEEDDKQTLGNFLLFDKTDLIFTAKSLELNWQNNKQFVSCIPVGEYICKRRHSVKYGWHFLVTNVPDRDYILIHKGNFHRDVKGCILLGRDHIDVDNDGYLDVTHSVDTLKQLNNSLSDAILFPLTVIDQTKPIQRF